MLGDYEDIAVRTATILTTSYVKGNILETPRSNGVADQNQLVVRVAFTIGSLTTAELKVEFSPDDTTYYQETFQAISTGTATETLGIHQFGASGNYRILIPIKDRYIKISVKGTGTVTGSSMTVDTTVGTV